jgi:hypothetical protein
MEGFSGGLIEADPMCKPPCPASATEGSFKMDEGYSEETRSQYDGDSSMGVDSRTDILGPMTMHPLTALQNVVMSLGESERSGIVA